MRIIQFAYRVGEPPGFPVVDCRVIKNPWQTRSLIETDDQRRERARQDPFFEPLVRQAVRLLWAHQTIAIGCTFGRHRSVAVTLEAARITGAEVQWHRYSGKA